MKRRDFIAKSSLSFFGLNFYRNSNQKIDQSRSTKEINHLSVTAPSTVRPNEEFSLHLKFVTDPYFTTWWGGDDKFNKSPRGTFFMKNTFNKWSGSLEISGSPDFSGMYKFSTNADEYWSSGLGELNGFSFREPGIKEIQVRDINNDIVGISNPILVSENPLNLYWGDLHCHSFFGDGIRSPEDLHLFARDEARLDVFALTEHTDLVTDDQWKYFINVANRFYDPGKFVSFIGGEWTSAKFGHRNFIYQDTGPIIRTQNANENNLAKLFSLVSNNNGLVIANHPNLKGFPIKFHDYVDPFSVERLVEVYSTGGSYENDFDQGYEKGDSVIDGLKGGRKFGFIGSGDTHDGRPGDSLAQYQIKPESYKDSKKPGIMGIWAEELTRESIFDSLWNRRVYGTTNNRTILKFSIDGNPMGSTIRSRRSLGIKVEVASALDIDKVELVQEGSVIENIHPKGKFISWNPSIQFEKIKMDTWFYVKVFLEDNNYAWSSPIWIIHA